MPVHGKAAWRERENGKFPGQVVPDGNWINKTLRKGETTMKARKSWLWMAGLLTLALTVGPAKGLWAAPAGGSDEGGPIMMHEQGEEPDEQGPGNKGFRELNLSSEQFAKLRQDRMDGRRQMIKTTAEMQTLHLDMNEELMKDKPDLSKIEKIANQIGNLHARMILQRSKAAIFFKSILTPEQRKKLDEMHLQMGGMGPEMGMGMGHGMERGWGKGKGKGKIKMEQCPAGQGGGQK